MKKKAHMPHSYLIVLCMILLAVVLTWIIPPGEFTRETNSEGIVAIDPQSYRPAERKPANPLKIPQYIVTGFTNNTPIILVLLFSGGAFHLVAESGALEALLRVITRKLRHQRYLLLILLTVMFGLICSNQALHIFIPFVPVLVMLSRALGFDSITGVATLILGGGIGFSTGTLRTTTTLIAQEIAQLPPYSGLWFRFICLAVFLFVTCIFLCVYAKTVAAHPEVSFTYAEDQNQSGLAWQHSQDSEEKFSKTQLLVLLVLIGFMALIVVGSICWGWSISDIAGVFVWMAVLVGGVCRIAPGTLCRKFTEGAAGMLPAVILTGMGTSIGVIFDEANIIDTVVMGLSSCIGLVPNFLRAAVLYLINTVVNVFITSGTAQAAVIMPIFIPLSDMMGITRQSCVLAYNFGDGFSNYILPTSSALMGILGAAGVSYGSWVRFMGKIFAVWVILGCILAAIAQAIQLGPM